MLYVLISVMCSVTVSIVIKLAKQRGIQHLHLIVWNYPVAALATLLFLKPGATTVVLSTLPWGLYLSLAVLLPLIFLCIAYAIQYSGIVKTEIAQRLSLFIPLLASFFIFHETIGVSKLLGIAVGIAAILCSIGWKKGGIVKRKGTWGYAVAVFFGMGIIDILFKKVALYKQVPYTYSMLLIFILAIVVSFLLLTYRIAIKKERIQFKSVIWGILLGLFNFGNILFYMKAHQALSNSPSVVFTGMNIGVILLGAIVGVGFFGERLTRLNKIGLLLAVISVLIIAYL
ncbi:DMT family transporter [Sphingobacterium chuzhouense]|uniref:DMT family transporter n=1 Tax=Sphingobacterium chuzhouense TaxID=1742264 RepID=A0ABR7XUJ4_9SPHI|nr:DMT family transporter [Sphingobacterium chuzhouense]MBD1422720.1 DMT family transporter [Sphingobacterium chuzhouense]